MAENSETIANRDSPIPIVSVTSPDDDVASSPDNGRNNGKRQALKHSLSSEKLKEKLKGLESQKAESPNRLHDRLFTMYG